MVSHIAGETFFSSLEFNSAWVKSFGNGDGIFGATVDEPGDARTMYGIRHVRRSRPSSLEFGPQGLYGSPGWNETLHAETVKQILRQIRKVSVESFIWNVRFDQPRLAELLAAEGLQYRQNSTHVLSLRRPYSETFAGYHSTMRNHVRRAHRSGLTLRNAVSEDDVRAYHRMYELQALERGSDSMIYPVELFLELVRLQNVRLLLASRDGQLAAGALFFVDGDSVFYWHGAREKSQSRSYPACAVLDEAVRWALELGVSFFNFGGSVGCSSLERFKSAWGARQESNWMFTWSSPVWSRVSRIRGLVKRNA